MAFIDDVYDDLEKQAILRAFHRIPSIGKYYELWNLRGAEVVRFIKANNLKPVHIGAPAAAVQMKELTDWEGPVWWRKWGGWPLPHMHYNGEIFAVTPEQWTSFSQGILKSVAEKLQNAGNVSFQAALEVTEAVAKL